MLHYSPCCGTVPCLSIFPALVSPAFAEGSGSFFSSITTLLQKVVGREAMRWSGMGSLALPLWYTPGA